MLPTLPMPSFVRAAAAAAALLAAAAAQHGAAPAGGADGWWAYRPLQRPEVPAVRAAGWVRNPVDAYVLAGLERRGLTPAGEADRHTLLRRVTYDLTGLPPTADEIAAFVADAAPDAYEKVVDRLLASPQHGVKWAQHWLDCVRYAETDGYERDRKKPFIWRYRDWVVDAFNADLPYGEFLHKQLAGDELPDPKVADLIATGVHRLGIWDDEPTDREQHRYDDLDGVADTAARTMLALSLGCARCHDHKKDPLSQAEYHSLLGFFENLRPQEANARAVPVDGARERFERDLADYTTARDDATKALRAAASASWDAMDDGARMAAAKRALADVVASYPGERGSAARLIDEVAGQDGQNHGQVVQVPGVFGQALRFDGDDHVTVPRVVTGSFSITFFVRSERRGGGNGNDTRWFTGTGLVDGEVGGVVRDFGVAWHSDGRVVAGTGDPETFVASGPGHHDGQWHHVAFTRDQQSGRVALYVDGVLCGEATGSKAPLDAPKELTIGRMHPGGRGFVGDLDEIAFHGRALVAAEVAALAYQLPGGVAAAPAIAELPAFAQLRALRRPDIETVEVLAVQEHGGNGPEAFVRLRGNVHSKGPKVQLAFPALAGGGAPAQIVPTQQSSGRRTALAQWITRPDHVLTWRVAANRVFQHHFGRGIVRSSSDFGRLGDQPTHPELLDWLATELVARGQSLKALHKLLVTSATYRMASTFDEKAAAVDPQNDALWRFDRRRLTAEEIRDSILAMTGELNLERGGPSVYPPMPKEVLATASRPDDAWGNSPPEQAARRSLYVHVKRSLAEPLLAGFDRADTDSSCPVRFATVQPTQALTMLNGDFAQLQAQRFAARLMQQAQGIDAQVRLGLELVTQRSARADDERRLLALASELRRDHGRDEAQALQRVCLVLLNANEFVYLD